MICVCVDIQEGNLEIVLDGSKEGFLMFTGGVVLIYLASWFPSVVNVYLYLSLVIASNNSFRGLFSVSLWM